jgi:hypothetical protein
MVEWKTLRDEMSGYAQDIRSDWSDFDGRSLLGFVTDWLEQADTMLAEKDKERAKVEQHWSDYALAEVRSLVGETQEKLAEKDKFIENMKKEWKIDKDIIAEKDKELKTEQDKFNTLYNLVKATCTEAVIEVFHDKMDAKEK